MPIVASRARTLPPTSSTTDPHPVSPLARCTGISAHNMHITLHRLRFRSNRRAGRRLPPTIDYALLTFAASDPRRRLQVMNPTVPVGMSRHGCDQRNDAPIPPFLIRSPIKTGDACARSWRLILDAKCLPIVCQLAKMGFRGHEKALENIAVFKGLLWLREQGLNLRPSGYE